VLLGVQLVAVSSKHDGIVLDAALGVITVAYFVLQVALGGVVCMFFADLPLTPVLVFEMVLLAAYLLVCFLMYGMQSHQAAQRHNDQRSVRRMRLWEAEVLNVADRTQDASLIKALQALAEEFHDSDPTILPELAEIDGRIAHQVAKLPEVVAAEEAEQLAVIENLSCLLKERGRMAAILKR